MSLSLTTLHFDHRGSTTPPHPHHIVSTSSISSNKNMSSLFGNIKKSLSRRGSNPLSSDNSAPGSKFATSKISRSGNTLSAPQRDGNPFRAAPATRRPDRLNSNAANQQPSEPPPAYTPRPVSSAAVVPVPNASSGADDPYAFLGSFDTIFVVDDSGSMAGRSWRETGKALQTITPICVQRDADGIDIYFLNQPNQPHYHGVKLASTIIEIFETVRPGGGTPTGQRLNQILRTYMKAYERNPDQKPINIIVITDGEPSDDVESPIIAAAKKLDKLEAPAWQVGIQFFQVGKEAGAREHLKQLDDGLAELAGEDIRDIVDTVPFSGADDEELTAAGIMKVVLGSVNRRLDRNSKDLHRRAT